MPKTPRPPGGSPGPIDFVWIKNQFEQLHHEHALILDRINSIEKLCQLILAQLKKVPPAHLNFAVGPVNNKPTTTTGNNMLEINITNEQMVLASLKPVTATGKPAKVDGVPTWEVISGNSAVFPKPDGMSADLISADDPGDTQFLIKADADLGEGVVEISDIITLHVAGAQAANLGLSAGDPTPKPSGGNLPLRPTHPDAGIPRPGPV